MALLRAGQISGSVGGTGTGFSITSGSVTASVNVSNDIFLIQSASQTYFSVSSSGAVIVTGSASDLFLVKNANNQTLLRVSQSGVIVIATQSAAPTGIAPNGGIYFTSSSFFVGLD